MPETLQLRYFYNKSKAAGDAAQVFAVSLSQIRPKRNGVRTITHPVRRFLSSSSRLPPPATGSRLRISSKNGIPLSDRGPSVEVWTPASAQAGAAAAFSAAFAAVAVDAFAVIAASVAGAAARSVAS